MSTLYLIGGTGSLGKEIAPGLVEATGFTAKKALDRDATKAQPLQDCGWEIVVVADMMNGSELEAALADAKVVVSTAGGGDMTALEMAVAKAAKAAGASLFVPSQFGVDYRRWGTSFPFLAAKKKVLDFCADELDLATLAVFSGYFSDFIFGFLADPVQGKARLIGDGSALVSFTRRSDIGKVLAKALAEPQYYSQKAGTLSLQGETMPWKQALETLETATGKKLELEYVDPQDALQQEQDLLKAGLQGDVGAFYGAFALHLLGEPARGNTGTNVSAESNTYGVKMETLAETLRGIYGASK